jgi:type IV secretory pathway VirB10-like protein
MQIFRTLIWILVTAILVGFLFMNWGEPVPVRFWPVEDGYVRFEWPVGIVALFFFFLGLLPMWMVHRGAKWRLNRRIASLENTVRATSAPPPTPPAAVAAPPPPPPAPVAEPEPEPEPDPAPPASEDDSPLSPPPMTKP